MKQITDMLKPIKRIINLEEGSDKEKTIEQINNDVYMRGANVVYLVCSALLASIGLDVSSPAVIIGAMLISPLMSPILGIGLSLGIHEKEKFIISVREFAISVAIGFLVSYVYFLITPLGNATTELLARVKPTVLDLLVAFFGGTAGIVAISRTRAAAALPGVAIATALMPPVCTAGFGLASGNYNFFFGAIYLFFINAVFISFSAYLFVRYLKFPVKAYADSRRLMRTRIIVLVFVILVAVPSFYIFYGVITDARFTGSVEKFVKTELPKRNLKVIDWKYVKGDNGSNHLNVYAAGREISKVSKDTLETLLNNYGIGNTKFTLTLLSDEEGKEYFRNELSADIMSKVKLMQKSQEELFTDTEKKMYENDSAKLVDICRDLKFFMPEIESIGYSKNYFESADIKDSSNIKRMTLFRINWRNGLKKNRIIGKENEIREYLKTKIIADTIAVMSEK
ncbi:MAG: DUF389 domain-containing protein [Bacteroidetes bacterium]|nr:DUF389 domain-containing protein [Bacteroidota bacterium]